MSDNFIPMYNLEALTEPQRQQYLKNVCLHMGVPDNLNLVALTYIDEGDGPSRLVAYAKRGATENVRNNLQIDITSLTNQMIGGSIVFTATATSKKTGRQEISTGSKWIQGLEGISLDDSIMTAQTRALRRVTLQFIGAGVLDESEVGRSKAITTSVSDISPAPTPIVEPSSEPGKDVTPEVDVHGEVMTGISGTFIHREDTSSPVARTQEQFEAEQAKLRADAIAQLNAKIASVEPVQEPLKKTRKPRGPNKPKVNLGPSEVPPAQAVVKPEPAMPQAAIVALPTETPAPVQAVNLTEPPVQVKPKLTPDQIKPFRGRLFDVVNNQLEPNGFAPKEGMGNADKMRYFAGVMFPQVTNMNQLDESQWDKFLTHLETKIKDIGPVETIKYIEQSIGI